VVQSQQSITPLLDSTEGGLEADLGVTEHGDLELVGVLSKPNETANMRSDSDIKEQRLYYRNDFDELTGQLNRARLTDALNAVIMRCSRSRRQSAFLMVAINNLPMVNETFGHKVGDEVIGAVANAIKGKLRGGDTLGRYSVDTFGIILNDCGPDAMQIAADRFGQSDGTRQEAVEGHALQSAEVAHHAKLVDLLGGHTCLSAATRHDLVEVGVTQRHIIDEETFALADWTDIVLHRELLRAGSRLRCSWTRRTRCALHA